MTSSRPARCGREAVNRLGRGKNNITRALVTVCWFGDKTESAFVPVLKRAGISIDSPPSLPADRPHLHESLIRFGLLRSVPSLVVDVKVGPPFLGLAPVEARRPSCGLHRIFLEAGIVNSFLLRVGSGSLGLCFGPLGGPPLSPQRRSGRSGR